MGFSLSNTYQTKFKKGDKFKKNDVIASDAKFFTDDINGNRFNLGSLQKVAIFATGETFEDNSFITQKCAQDLASEIVMEKSVTLGKNSSVDHIVNIGDHVKVGDELIRFETSYEEEYLNDLLANVGEELGEEIKSYGKKPIKSKYSGEIVDIVMYHTVPLDQLSPSLKKLVSEYNKKINTKKNVLDKYKNDGDGSIYKCGMLYNKASDVVETKDGKIKGEYVGEGVLIQFYIKYTDIASVGDKFANFCALKSIIGNVIPEGEEPFSEFRPDEEIGTFLPPASILARMTPSIIITAFTNKTLVELKRSLKEIYDK